MAFKRGLNFSVYSSFVYLLYVNIYLVSLNMSTLQLTPKIVQNESKLTVLVIIIELTRAILMPQF